MKITSCHSSDVWDLEVATGVLKIVWIPELLSLSLSMIKINGEKSALSNFIFQLYISFSDPARDFLTRSVDLVAYHIGMVPISLR